MFIVVEHDITNQDAFFGAAEDVVNQAPADAKPVQFFPSTDSTRAVCLWQAESVDAVKNYLAKKLGASSKDTYYAVDSKAAIGLPANV